ncbi:MAG TPA: response regulator [Candidatus Acidoferrales bacterium]|nr:response regulator [Candidatus Acidoferrales bacterium]
MPKILVADDNTNIQKMVSLAFEERGIDVVAVGNGEAAVRRIPDMNPDLVLADIFMPVRNGYEVCEFVKKDERFSHVPVILLVGAFDPLDEKEARRVGADGVLKKPFVPPDPLIAMVISALEKNPKVAAEMAKAREVIPPEPEPMPAILEAPARAEVKPLPEFPEPSSEEAALVYGFGSGKRGKEAPSEDDMGPVSPHIEEEEAEDESDATSHDWRRNAMDFEVPEETSKRTAFALDDESAAAMFPSEKDVPPRHVHMKEHRPLVDTEAATRIAPMPSFVPPPPTPVPVAPVKLSDQLSGKASAPSVPDFAGPVAPPNDEHDSFLTATMLGTMPAPPPAAPVEPKQSAPVFASPVSPAPDWNAPEQETPAVSAFTEAKKATEGKEESAREIAHIAPVVEFETATSFATQGAHWMDAMTAALKDAHADASDGADPTPAVKMNLDERPVTAPIAAAPVVLTPAAFEAPALSEELAVAPEPIRAEEEEFFADENEGASDWLPVVSAETKKVTVAVDEPALEASGPVPVSHLAADPELIAEPDDSGPISKDPALVEPPPVHVTPELLLVDEDSEPTSSQYDKHEEETAPAFAFEAPAHASVSEEAADERIPTMAPPNREVLAEIPFLSPPAEFLAPKAEEAKPAGQDVDAVVQKVLEKLEPHLRDLLSQGVKPLVENILQSETIKKSR